MLVASVVAVSIGFIIYCILTELFDWAKINVNKTLNMNLYGLYCKMYLMLNNMIYLINKLY